MSIISFLKKKLPDFSKYDIPKITLPKRGMDFKVGEGLTPEQKKIAKVEVRKPGFPLKPAEFTREAKKQALYLPSFLRRKGEVVPQIVEEAQQRRVTELYGSLPIGGMQKATTKIGKIIFPKIFPSAVSTVVKKEVAPVSKQITKTLQPLAQEARKYKSAEEFVERINVEIRNKFRDSGIRGKEQLTKFWNSNVKPTIPVLDNLNPTGNLLVDYTPRERATIKLGDNITTLNKTSGKSQDTIITIYRGAPKSQKGIVAGDYITTNYDLAKSYTGDGNVLSKKVKMKNVLDDIESPLGEEYIYRPITQATKGVGKVKPKSVEERMPESLAKQIEKEVRQEVGTAGNLANAIRLEGGIKMSKGIKEEIDTSVPIFLRKNNGVNLDEMVSQLKNHGIHFEDTTELLNAISKIPGRRVQIKSVKPSIPQKRVSSKLSEFQKLLKAEKKEGVKEGKEIATEKIMTEKEKIQRRRSMIKSVKSIFGLSDADLKKISRKDIRLMNNFEFKKFLDDLEFKALQFTEKRQAMNELLQQIRDKELDVENLRKAMKLPTMKNMTIKDIKALDEAIKPFLKGDEFLSVRKLETVDRTELKGIKTWREARERLAKKLNTSVDKLKNIRVSEFDRFRYDTALAEKNPFYRMMVEEPAKRMLVSEAEYLKIEKKILNSVKKIKGKTIVGRLIPQYKKIRKFMESKPEDKAKINLTKEELDLVNLMTKEFDEARDYLIKIEAMNLGKDNYFTHIRRGILEATKEDGIVTAVKEIFTQYKLDEQAFNILDRETGEILAMDKFFKFAMHRTGGLVPTENVVRAFLTYMKTFKKKQALDEIVPLVDIYAHALTPKEATKTGVLLQGNLIRFVKEWLNTQKGRHITLVAKQGGKIDGALRAIKMFTSLRDLGFNIPVSIATEVGEQITTYQLLGKKKFAVGKIRQNTKQGKVIIEKYRNIIGKNPWKEIAEPAKEIGDRLMEGIFILFKDASTRANKTFLLGSLSKQEFQSGVITPKRLAALRTELGRYRMVEGMKSVIGATPEGKSYTQYKKWAIPILRTTIKNLANISKKITRQKISSKEWKKSSIELYRLVEITAFMMLMFSMVRDKDDKSFIGQIINKAYRESTTLIQALQPKMFATAGRTVSFITDLGENLTSILLWEEYKTKEGLKGVESLKRQLTPVAVSQFKKTKKKTSIIKGLDLDLKLDLDLDLNLDLGL